MTEFHQVITELYGDEGLEWLDHLPALIDDCARRWSLDAVLPPFEPLTYNYVAPAVRAGGTKVILKLGVPNPELLTEIEALQLYDGRGAVRLLAADRGRGALLLERLEPGTPLSDVVDDGEATRIAAGVMQRLWRPAPVKHSFPTIARWARGLQRLRARFDGGTGPFPASLVEAAESLFAGLVESTAEPVLLHGDLHHGNILAARREPWLAIDPKGLVGEPAYEVGALLRNPPGLLDGPRPGQTLARRVDLLAEILGFDRARLVGWGLAQAVLSAWWSFEDHGHGWEWAIACAGVLAGIE